MPRERRLRAIPEPRERWSYPSLSDAVLYVTCAHYDADSFPEEHLQVVKSTGGVCPTVQVTAGVSGRHPGDAEVRHLVEVLLGRFHGYAFDDYTAHEHGWTLGEIRDGLCVSGLGFFDYRGSYLRLKKNSA